MEFITGEIGTLVAVFFLILTRKIDSWSYLFIGVCTDTYVIYQSVLKK